MRRGSRHPFLMLAALVAAVALWYSVTGQRRERISEKRLLAPLTLINVPQDLVITNEVPEHVALGLRGPLSALRALEESKEPEVILDLAGSRPGLRRFALSTRNVALPREVRLVSVDPPEVSLRLERLEKREVPVKVTLEGSPRDGFKVTSVKPVPQTVTVSGPGSLLSGLEEVTCGPVNVEGAEHNLEVSVPLELPHPLLKSLSASTVRVLVEVSPVSDTEEAEKNG